MNTQTFLPAASPPPHQTFAEIEPFSFLYNNLMQKSLFSPALYPSHLLEKSPLPPLGSWYTPSITESTCVTQFSDIRQPSIWKENDGGSRSGQLRTLYADSGSHIAYWYIVTESKMYRLETTPWQIWWKGIRIQKKWTVYPHHSHGLIEHVDLHELIEHVELHELTEHIERNELKEHLELRELIEHVELHVLTE